MAMKNKIKKIVVSFIILLILLIIISNILVWRNLPDGPHRDANWITYIYNNTDL